MQCEWNTLGGTSATSCLLFAVLLCLCNLGWIKGGGVAEMLNDGVSEKAEVKSALQRLRNAGRLESHFREGKVQSFCIFHGKCGCVCLEREH